MFRLALPSVVVVIGIACGAASAAQGLAGNGSRKVEFEEVKGHPCLQPVVKSADAVLADYRAAERRWLTEHFPGRPAPRWQNQLVLQPSADGGGENAGATMQTETAFVQAGDGSEIAVCFDIGLSSAGAHEQPTTAEGK